jgi:hypothetical protein
MVARGHPLSAPRTARKRRTIAIWPALREGAPRVRAGSGREPCRPWRFVAGAWGKWTPMQLESALRQREVPRRAKMRGWEYRRTASRPLSVKEQKVNDYRERGWRDRAR